MSGLHLVPEAVERLGEFAVHLDKRIDKLNSETAECINTHPEFARDHLINYLFNLNHIIKVPPEILDLVFKLNK